MKRTKKILIWAVAVVAIGGIFLVSGKDKFYSLNAKPQLRYEVNNTYSKPIKNYRNVLCDQQTVQLPSAKKYGIPPMEDAQGIDSMVDAERLVKVPHSKYLWVKADYPYLIPEAYDLLLEIARRYQEKIGGHPHLRVTSCLRTNESIKELQTKNSNAVKNSCHLYGTTFDISYARMSDSQKDACAKVLKEMRDAGYLYAVYEQNQPCFHVTIRKPGSAKLK